MPTQYTKEQLWNLYKNLPEELKNVLASPDVTDGISNICENNGVKELYSDIANLSTRVLLGILPPDDFQVALEKELELNKDVAKKVAREIHRFVFYPVKTSLEQLYKIETKQAPAPEVKHEIRAEAEAKISAPEKKIEKQDTYRETVE